jgi:hypothetical protein
VRVFNPSILIREKLKNTMNKTREEKKGERKVKTYRDCGEVRIQKISERRKGRD